MRPPLDGDTVHLLTMPMSPLESFTFKGYRFITGAQYRDSSHTMTEEACHSLPQTKLAEQLFKWTQSSHIAGLALKFGRSNPLPAINKQGDFTLFATRLVTAEDSSFSKLIQISLKARSISLGATGAANYLVVSSQGAHYDGGNR